MGNIIIWHVYNQCIEVGGWSVLICHV